MSTPLRHLLTRVVLYERSTGNILDLPARRLMESEIPQVEEERSPTAGGSTRKRQQTTRAEIRLKSQEEAQLARLMADSCRVGMIALGKKGSQHVVWDEACQLSRVPEPGAPMSYAPARVALESPVFDPAIWAGQDLIAGVPWVGTSAQPSLEGTSGIAVADNGRLAVIDDVAGEVVLFDSFDGQVVDRFDVLSDARDLTYYSGRQEFIASANVTDLGRYDPDGTLIDIIEPEDESGSPITGPLGVTIGGGDLIVQDESDNFYRYDGVPVGGAVEAKGQFSVTNIGVTPSLAFDDTRGRLISSFDGGGLDKVVREHNGAFTATIDETVDVPSRAAVAVQRGNLITALEGDTSVSPADLPIRRHDGITGTVTDDFNAGRRQPLIQGGIQADRKPGYDGPYWRHVAGGSVNILGETTGITDTDPAFLQFVFPIPGAEIRLEGVTGALDGLDFGGTAININDSSRIGSPPQLLLEGGKYSGLDINSSSVWYVRARIDSAAAIPQLVVVDPGTPRGVRRGGVVSDCSQRITSPQWGAPVETVAFDVDADAGDKISIRVTEAPGTDNYIGQISGDGESIKGESATFDYSNAGTFTAEMIAQPDFEGVTEAILQGPVDLSTLGDLGSLTDATQFKFTSSKLSGELPSSAIPSSLKRIDGQDAFKASLQTLSSITRIVCESTEIFGDFENLGVHEWLIVSRSAGPFSGRIDGSQFDGKTKRIAINRIGGFELDLTPSTGIPSTATNVEFVNLRSIKAGAGGDVTLIGGTMDEIVRASDKIKSLRAQASRGIGGDFTGFSMPGSLSSIKVSQNDVTAPFDDHSQATSLSTYIFGKGNDDNVQFNAGALDTTINDLHSNRTVFSGNNPSLRFREVNTTRQLRSSKSDASLDRLYGLSSFHPFNGGEGMLDVGATFSFERELIQVQIDSFDPNGGADGAGSVTFTVSFQTGGGGIGEVDRVNGGVFQFDEGPDQNNREWTAWLWHTGLTEGSGHPQEDQQFRLIGSGGADHGLYEVLDHTATDIGGAATVTVEVDSNPDSSAQTALDGSVQSDDIIVFYAQPRTDNA